MGAFCVSGYAQSRSAGHNGREGATRKCQVRRMGFKNENVIFRRTEAT